MWRAVREAEGPDSGEPLIGQTDGPPLYSVITGGPKGQLKRSNILSMRFQTR